MAKKRMNGEGSLRQRSDGRWEYRVTDGYRDDGKLKTISFYGKTQSEVKKKLDEYRKKKAAGIDMSKKYTFAQWADIWFENHTDVSATSLIADLDLCVGQLTQLFNRLYIGSAHIRSGDNAKLSAILCKLPKLVH